VDARIIQHPAAALEWTQDFIGVVIDKPDPLRPRPGLIGGGQRGADHRRGLAAFSDREHHIILVDAMIGQLQRADQRQVFKAFQ